MLQFTDPLIFTVASLTLPTFLTSAPSWQTSGAAAGSKMGSSVNANKRQIQMEQQPDLASCDSAVK
jgi:hypothetical protein